MFSEVILTNRQIVLNLQDDAKYNENYLILRTHWTHESALTFNQWTNKNITNTFNNE